MAKVTHSKGELTGVAQCYFAALAYGLRLIDEKAKRRGELFIPVDIYREKTLPEIDCSALRDFVQNVGDRIAKANNL